MELASVSKSELKANVTGLISKVDDIIARIDKLKERHPLGLKRSEIENIP